MRFALVLLAACGGPPLPPPRSNVDNLGAEPRRILAITPTLGVETFECTAKQRWATHTTDTTFETHDAVADFPSVKLTGHRDVLARDPDGTTHVNLVIDHAELLDDKLGAHADDAIAKLEAARASLTVTQRGQVHVNGDLPAPLRGLGDATLELPAQAIGAGATWTLDDTAVIADARWSRHITYQLRELTQASAVVDVAMKLRADSQALRVEPTATTRLTSGTGTATATAVIRFDRSLAAWDSHTTLEMNLQIVRKHARVASVVTSESWFSIHD